MRTKIVDTLAEHIIAAFKSGTSQSPEFERELLKASPLATTEEWNAATERAIKYLVRTNRWALLRARFFWPLLQRFGLLGASGAALSEEAPEGSQDCKPFMLQIRMERSDQEPRSGLQGTAADDFDEAEEDEYLRPQEYGAASASAPLPVGDRFCVDVFFKIPGSGEIGRYTPSYHLDYDSAIAEAETHGREYGLRVVDIVDQGCVPGLVVRV